MYVENAYTYVCVHKVEFKFCKYISVFFKFLMFFIYFKIFIQFEDKMVHIVTKRILLMEY